MRKEEKAIIDAAKAWHPKGECTENFYHKAKNLADAVEAVRALEAAQEEPETVDLCDMISPRHAVERERKAFVTGSAYYRDVGEEPVTESRRRYPMPGSVDELPDGMLMTHKHSEEPGARSKANRETARLATGCTCHLPGHYGSNPACHIHGKSEADILDGLIPYDKKCLRTFAARIQAPLLARIEELERKEKAHWARMNDADKRLDGVHSHVCNVDAEMLATKESVAELERQEQALWIFVSNNDVPERVKDGKA